ncbi:hypothetical protein BDZ94DRAFT_1273028 [Collybia nuda]|uniref:Uncharacterized protein n=1 Tax=Collybia nuda TaxID=64659 RepID=A0A9P5XTY4_9AGAR|nr:hypothetical protein BDZ94DRAFT_1273028 [Collybia nuda]
MNTSSHPPPSTLEREMTNSSGISLPNPFTYTAFLPPDQAFERTMTEYVVVGGLSILTWDIVVHMRADYKLFLRHRIHFPAATYLFSRWSTLAYAITTVLFLTASVEDCMALVKAKCVVYHLSASSTSFLFFLRVRAVFERNIYITAGFFLLWLIVSGGTFLAVVNVSGTHIGTSRHCDFEDVKSYLTAIANITLALFDTCIFIAITWRLSDGESSLERGVAVRQRRLNPCGRHLPEFSRGLLRDGQQYYMVAMLANLLVLTMEFVPGIPLQYRTIFLAPAMELTNIMACHVFRHTKKGGIEEEGPSAVSEIVFQNSGSNFHVRTGVLATSSIPGDGLHGPDRAKALFCSSGESGHGSKEGISVGLEV